MDGVRDRSFGPSAMTAWEIDAQRRMAGGLMINPTVAVIAPGNMGAAVGARLVENGLTVVTSLAGRSKASAERAAAAGMTPVSDGEVAQADFLLSIVPPGDALALAERFAPMLQSVGRKPLYVDCNAV